MLRTLALSAVCAVLLTGSALAQDAETVIANAQKALGIESITYSGSAKDVSFQQCGANAAAHDLPGHARSDAADHQLRARHRSCGAGVARTPAPPTTSARRLDDDAPGNVLPAGHAAAGGRVAAVGAARSSSTSRRGAS